MIRPHWVVLPLLAVTSAAESPKQPEVRLAQSPPRLFAERGTAITYYVEGPKASRLREVRFPLAPLLEGKSAPDRDFVLLAFSNGRYCVLVPANAGDELLVRFRLQVDTEANEDGIAIAVVDYFGFPANLKSDYDSVVTKAS